MFAKRRKKLPLMQFEKPAAHLKIARSVYPEPMTFNAFGSNLQKVSRQVYEINNFYHTLKPSHNG